MFEPPWKTRCREAAHSLAGFWTAPALWCLVTRWTRGNRQSATALQCAVEARWHPFRALRGLHGACFLIACLATPRISTHSVEVQPGFIAEIIATNLNAATAIAPSPDGRIFIADQTGSLRLWKDGRVLDTPALTLHVTDYWERGLIGLALDPDFPRAPHLYTLSVTDQPFVHHVLSRFTLEGDRVDPSSQKILIEGDDQAKLGGGVQAGHQGGVLRFDADGKLYVSLGEQTAGEPAQELATLQGKILRLNRDGSIPDDNPFLTRTTGKYGAIYARGVRNSFGLAAQTRADGGKMFFTDVGGSAFEEVNELKPGANYGWPHAEGFSTNFAFTNPLHVYPAMIGQSIVGGVFVPSSKSIDQRSNWPEKWRGKFLFADFMKHWIKALDPGEPTKAITFAKGFNGPVATELAPDGSLLVLDRGAVWRDPKKFVANAGSLIRIRYVGGSTVPGGVPVVVPARSRFIPALGLPADGNALPRTLSRVDWESRLRGVKRWPLWLNSNAWLPFTRETVGLYFPSNAMATLSGDNKEVVLPPGAVVVREFSVNKWRAKSPHGEELPRPIETRLLVVGAPRGYGASYRWKSAELAELIEDGELERFSDLSDVKASEDTPKKVSLPWWFSGMDDGIRFPVTNPAYWVSLFVEDFVFPRASDLPERAVNTLRAMRLAGVLATTLSPEELDHLPRGVMWQSPLQPAEARVRSYLHGNCAVCHQPGGASRGLFDARIGTPLGQAGMINGEVAAGDLGIPGAKIVVPGQPEKSILLRRLKDTGFFRMPPVQYHNEPSPILPVMEEWIRSLQNNSATARP